LPTPGKDQRLSETLLTDMNELAAQYAQQITEQAKGKYLLFGHSMGALMANLVIQKLVENGGLLPHRVVVSSYPAPMHHHDRGRTEMTDVEFVNHMKKLNGLPPRLLAEPSLMRIFLPILRADILAIDNYRYQKEEKHNVPMTVLFGSQETVLSGLMLDWQKETTVPISVKRFEGGHFFIFEQLKKMMELFEKVSG